MGFIGNIKENFFLFLINKLSKGIETEIEIKLKDANEYCESLEYRKSDYIYLFQNGFNYDKTEDVFFKDEDIDYGKFQGKYNITVKLPDNYPKKPPVIKFKPLFSGPISKHIIRDEKDYRDYTVCVASEDNHLPNAYWKANMNARGALLLAYQTITGQLERTRKDKPKAPITGTIIEDISKVSTITEFVNHFGHLTGLKVINNTYTWEEIAYKTAKANTTIKKELVKYLNTRRKIKSKQ